MLPHKKFCEQLAELYHTGALQKSPLCQHVFYDTENHSMYVATAPPTNVDAVLKLDHLELKITYSDVYQEPQLLLRVWQEDLDSEFTGIKLWFPQDVKRVLDIGNQFQLGLDAVSTDTNQSTGVWYSFHPCDTADIVGDKVEYIDKYLERWLSVFLSSWLA